MTDMKKIKMSRRELLKKSLLIPIAAAVPAVIASRRADAAPASKAPKAAMLYMDKPHGKDKCANCIHFQPAKAPGAAGSCTVVAGAISPHGWCVAYTRKSGA